MIRRSSLRVLRISADLLLAASFVALVAGMAWEFSTRSYLRGFADAVVPVSAPPEQKVESILHWMAFGPARGDDVLPPSADRDPEETLNNARLMAVCGTATNAFVNLAEASGLKVRRLLLLGSDDRARHVVAEVLLEGQWAVVDPAYRTIFRDPQGHFLTKEQLRDPAVWRQATARIPDYPASYTYSDTEQIRLQRIPVVGGILERVLDSEVPSWQDINWTLFTERKSFALCAGAALVLILALLARVLLWYAGKRIGAARLRIQPSLEKAMWR